MAKGKESQKLIANNKKAYHDFFIDETYECGIALHGTEVKSMRMGKCSIKEAFVRIEDGEVFVYGMHVSPYEKGNIFNKDPLRVKKLLLHKYEINKLLGKIKEKGYTLVPLQVYFKDGGKTNSAVEPVHQYYVNLDCWNFPSGWRYRCNEYHAGIRNGAYQ